MHLTETEQRQMKLEISMLQVRIDYIESILERSVRKCELGIDNKWISVKDRLPELKVTGSGRMCSNPVLSTDGKHFSVAFRWMLGEECRFVPHYREDFSTITHWMELPDFPK